MTKAPLIGELQARRQALGWSLDTIGERCGIDKRLLECWEYGAEMPRLDAVETWAAALGMHLGLCASQQEVRRGVAIDWAARRITVDGTPVRLTPMEWKALERLAQVPGELVSHEALFRHLYGDERPYCPQSTAIRVLITKLRRMLPLRIEARWGRGYVVQGVSPSAATGHPAAAERQEAPAQPVRVINQMASSGTPAQLLENFVGHGKPGRFVGQPMRMQPPRAQELQSIERFLSERGATRCPDVATIEQSPLPTLVWDKVKRKWFRPALMEQPRL